jgi:hypothetical protein
MQTLSYGYKKPEPGDTGDVFYDAMSANMDALNAHTHNGSDSAPLTATLGTLAAGAWVAVGARPGIYSQVLNLSAGFSAYTSTFYFLDSSVNSVNLEYVVTSTGSITVYTNDSSEDYSAYYK